MIDSLLLLFHASTVSDPPLVVATYRLGLCITPKLSCRLSKHLSICSFCSSMTRNAPFSLMVCPVVSFCSCFSSCVMKVSVLGSWGEGFGELLSFIIEPLMHFVLLWLLYGCHKLVACCIPRFFATACLLALHSLKKKHFAA